MSGYWNVIRAELFKARRKRRTYILAALLWVVLGTIFGFKCGDSQTEDPVSFQGIPIRCGKQCVRIGITRIETNGFLEKG